MILSFVSRETGGLGEYHLLPSNGSYVRFPFNWSKRYVIRDSRKKRAMRIGYRCIMDEEDYFGWIEDEILVTRITEYMASYYGKKHTNCSAFAHFLTTGTFVECPEESSLLVLEQGMAAYKDQKVRVGDMICIVFARDRLCRSRNFGHNSKYLEVKKKRRKDDRFVHSLLPKNDTLTSSEVVAICKNVVSEDYHFMVCVGKYNGKPVWISQRGRYLPGEHPSPIAITVGEYDGYVLDVPLLTLIKRRRG